MTKRFCQVCKLSVGGFAFCPKCGSETDELGNLNSNNSKSPLGLSSSNSSNQSALWCHLGPLIITAISALTSFFALGFILALLAWVPPLIVKARNQEDTFVTEHAKESFNFQVFWLIITYGALATYLVFGVLTLGIGLIVGAIFLLLVAIPLLIFVIVVQIRGCVAASSGETYRYPLVLFRLMK